MTDVISSMRQVIQNLVTRDLEAVQAKLDSHSKQMEVMHDATMKTIDAFRAEMRSEFAALRASNQAEVMRQVSPLSGRLAVVERR